MIRSEHLHITSISLIMQKSHFFPFSFFGSYAITRTLLLSVFSTKIEQCFQTSTKSFSVVSFGVTITLLTFFNFSTIERCLEVVLNAANYFRVATETAKSNSRTFQDFFGSFSRTFPEMLTVF